MYASALPAGNFRGISAARVVQRVPTPSRDGARAAQRATNLALHRVGIQGLRGGLGDLDLCTDPGARFMQGLITGAGSVMAQAGAAQHDTGWSTAGGATGAVGQAWAGACAAGSTTAALPTESPQDVYNRAIRDSQYQAAQTRAADLDLQVRREREAAAAQQAQTKTYLMVGGGIAAAALLAFLVLR